MLGHSAMVFGLRVSHECFETRNSITRRLRVFFPSMHYGGRMDEMLPYQHGLNFKRYQKVNVPNKSWNKKSEEIKLKKYSAKFTARHCKNVLKHYDILFLECNGTALISVLWIFKMSVSTWNNQNSDVDDRLQTIEGWNFLMGFGKQPNRFGWDFRIIEKRGRSLSLKIWLIRLHFNKSQECSLHLLFKVLLFQKYHLEDHSTPFCSFVRTSSYKKHNVLEPPNSFLFL